MLNWFHFHVHSFSFISCPWLYTSTSLIVAKLSRNILQITFLWNVHHLLQIPQSTLLLVIFQFPVWICCNSNKVEKICVDYASVWFFESVLSFSYWKHSHCPKSFQLDRDHLCICGITAAIETSFYQIVKVLYFDGRFSKSLCKSHQVLKNFSVFMDVLLTLSTNY